MFTCQLSGAVPLEPVVTPDGHVYEKRLLLKALETKPQDPVSGSPLKLSQLIDVKPSLPIPPSKAIELSGFDNIIEALRARYDSLLLELHETRRERDEARKTVSELLYLRDAATKLVAQQLQEIEELKKREDLFHKTPRRDAVSSEDYVAEHVRRIDTLASALMAARKNRPAPPVPETVRLELREPVKLAGDSAAPLTAAKVVLDKREGPGVLALARDANVTFHQINEQNTAVVGSFSATHAVYALETLVYPSAADLDAAALGLLGANSQSCHPFASCLNAFVGGANGTVELWAANKLQAMEELSWLADINGRRVLDSDVPQLNLTKHYSIDMGAEAVVRTLQLHPSGTLCAAVAERCDTWMLVDVERGLPALNFAFEQPSTSARCPFVFQPDGALAVGSRAATLAIWDVRTTKQEFKVDTGELSCLAFSPNGYTLLAGAPGGELRLYDLRKPAKVPVVCSAPGPVSACSFRSVLEFVGVTEDGTLGAYTSTKPKTFSLATTSEHGWVKEAATVFGADSVCQLTADTLRVTLLR